DERKRTARKQAAARKKAAKVAPARARKRTGKASSAKTWSRRASALEGATSLRDDEPIGPQLALAKPSPPAGEKWLHEVKWDGYRMLARLRDGTVQLRSRNDLDWTDRLPKVAEALNALPVPDADLDGELIALDAKGRSDFGLLQQALKSGKPGDLRYALFEIGRAHV